MSLHCVVICCQNVCVCVCVSLSLSLIFSPLVACDFCHEPNLENKLLVVYWVNVLELLCILGQHLLDLGAWEYDCIPRQDMFFFLDALLLAHTRNNLGRDFFPISMCLENENNNNKMTSLSNSMTIFFTFCSSNVRHTHLSYLFCKCTKQFTTIAY
jgi:hypothetical protein